jgi:hypothetical protein
MSPFAALPGGAETDNCWQDAALRQASRRERGRLTQRRHARGPTVSRHLGAFGPDDPGRREKFLRRFGEGRSSAPGGERNTPWRGQDSTSGQPPAAWPTISPRSSHKPRASGSSLLKLLWGSTRPHPAGQWPGHYSRPRRGWTDPVGPGQADRLNREPRGTVDHLLPHVPPWKPWAAGTAPPPE